MKRSKSPARKAVDAAELRERLVDLILGHDVEFTGEQVSAKRDFEFEEAKRLWRALGFPDVTGEPVFGASDADALEAVGQLMETSLLDSESVHRIARALGRTMSRLADWQVEALVEQIERDIASGTATGRLERAAELAELATPKLEQLVVYAWRRHMAAAASRLEAFVSADDDVLSSVLTVGFVDLSRFTSLSNDLDDDALGHLVEDFEDDCTDVITDGGGRVIKTLGDAVLFIADEPGKGARIAFSVIAHIAARPDLPDVKVGLATGSVLSRMGDVFGPPVNLAARLTTVARSNRLLVDETTASQLGEEFEKRTLPARALRGFGLGSPITVSQRRAFRTS